MKVVNTNPTGAVNMMRPNHLQPPFDNPAVRQALLYAVDQQAFMQAIVGYDPKMYHTPHGVFCPNTPMASTVGLEPLQGPRDYPRAKERLKAAGYAGEKVSMLVATDYPQFKAIGDVMADSMSQAGMNVDYVATDWGTMLQRRNNKRPIQRRRLELLRHRLGRGGPPEPLQPLRHARQRRGRGRLARLVRQPEAGGAAQCLVGRAGHGRAEAGLRGHATPGDARRAQHPGRPVHAPTVYNTRITGVLNGFATFWNVRPA